MRLNLGDNVLVKAAKKDKLSSYYDPNPYVVTMIKGTMISASRGNHIITRNASLFKKIAVPQTNQQTEVRQSTEQQLALSGDDDVDEDIDPPSQAATQTPGVQQQPQQAIAAPGGNGVRNRYPPRQSRRLPQRFNDFIVGSVN